MAKRIIPVDDEGLPPPLPPAGDEQRDVLRERADRLEEAAETRAEQMETGTIDPRAFEVDREIRQHLGGDGGFNELEVSNQRPEYAYFWCFTGQGGRFVRLAQYLKWQVVQGDDPEAIELRGIGADSTRHLGDCILMKMRRDFYVKLQQGRKDALEAREAGVKGNLEELAAQHHINLIDLSGLPPTHPHVKRLAQQAEAQRLASQKVNQLIREGRMPGVRTT